MADLPQNQTYDNASQAMSSMVNKLSAIGKTLSRAKRKSADTTKYTGLVNNVKSNIGVTTVPYGGQTRGEVYHPGVDIANVIGTKIPAFVGGKVINEREGQIKGSPDFGNYIIVQDQLGNKFRYSHLSRSFVKIGDIVQPGQKIAEMGNTGNVYSEHDGGTGSHLDFRVQDIYNRYISPNQFING